jgi:hypothetical protein
VLHGFCALSPAPGTAPESAASEHLLADNGAPHAQALEIFGEIFRGQLRVPMPRISG